MKTVCSKRHDKHKFLHWCYVCGRGKVADWTWTFLKTTLVNKRRITLNIIYGGLLITNFQNAYRAGIYLLKVNNRNTIARCEICSKLTIKAPERCLSIINFEHVNADWLKGVLYFSLLFFKIGFTLFHVSLSIN